MVPFTRQQKGISKKLQTEQNFSALDLDMVTFANLLFFVKLSLSAKCKWRFIS